MASKDKRTAEGWERRRIRSQVRRVEKKGFTSPFSNEVLKKMTLDELKKVTTEDINRTARTPTGKTYEQSKEEKKSRRKKPKKDRYEDGWTFEYDPTTIGGVVLDNLWSVIEQEYKGVYSKWVSGEIRSAIADLGEDKVKRNLSKAPENLVDNIQRTLKYEFKGTGEGDQYVNDLVMYMRFGEIVSDEERMDLARDYTEDDDGEDYMI